MSIRVTGLNSGLDTDSIVSELVSAYSQKTEKYEKEQTLVEWKQDVWSSLNSKVYSLYTSISNLRFSSAYAQQKVTSSDTTKATVSASGSAVNGTQTLNVLQTAQSGYLTSGKLTSTSGSSITSDTTLKDLGFYDYDDGAVSTKLKVTTKDDDGNDVETEISLSSSSTISDVVSALQNAGLTASFDEANGRFYISSSDSGEENDFTISAADDDDGLGSQCLSALGFSTGTYAAGSKLTTAQGTATIGSTLAYLGYDSTYSSTSTSFNYSYTDANNQTVTGSIAIDSNTTTIQDIIQQFKDQGVNASFDGSTGQITFQDADNLKFSVDEESDEFSSEQVAAAQNALQTLGLATTSTNATTGETTLSTSLTTDDSKSAIKIDGCDSVIILNGVKYTSSTNGYTINGLTINVTGVTDDITQALDKDGNIASDYKSTLATNAITITTETDTQGLYDTIKDFLTQYNEIINEITELYNAESASDYEPLTDEEKDAMSDTEIEKWETKIKDSLLRRDTSLGSLMNSMINAMSQQIEVNGTKYSLSSFGIMTLGYLNAPENEQYAYHIDGDEDDENTSGNTDKLMTALTNDPDTVIEFMKQLTSNLYTAIDNNMQSTELRSRYSIYNDKELETQYSDYTTLISEWEDKVADKEDYYYSKFTAMETALAKLQSQSSSLTSLLS